MILIGRFQAILRVRAMNWKFDEACLDTRPLNHVELETGNF